MQKKLGLCASAALLPLLMLSADTYYQFSNDSAGTTSFTNASWAKVSSDTAQTIATIGTANTFVSAMGLGTGYLLRTPTGADATFPGDTLQIGSDDKDGSMMIKTGSGKTLTVQNLILKRGAIANGDGGVNTIKTTYPTIVQSTDSCPFYFTGGNDRALKMADAIVSEDSSAVIIANRYSLEEKQTEYTKSFTATFAGDNSGYKGRFIADGKSKSGKTDPETLVTLEFSAATSAGDDPTELLADGITVRNGAQLLFSSSTALKYSNRGITVDPTGGRIRRAGADLTLAMPLYGSGTLVANLDSGKKIILSSTVNGSVTLDCSACAAVSFKSRFAWNSTGSLILPGGVELTGQFVSQTDTMGAGNSYTNGTYWSNGTGVTDESTLTYLVYGNDITCRSPADMNGTLTFPSNAKVTVIGTGSKYASFMQKVRTFTIDNLVLGPLSRYQFGGDSSDQTANGTWRIASTAGNPARITSGDNRTATLNATLTGTGPLQYSCYNYKNDSNTVKIKGDNSGFKGTVKILGSRTDEIIVSVSKQSQIGGNPDSFEAAGLELAGGTLKATDSFSFDQSNRGVTFSAAAVPSKIDVDVTKTLTIAAPIIIADNATITKAGEGTLLFTHPSVSLNTFSGHLADGTYAKQTSNGIELTNTKPTSITVSDGGADVNINYFSDDILGSWLKANNATATAEVAASYLSNAGSGGLTGLQAFLLGYDSSNATPMLNVAVANGTLSFGFNGSGARELSGVTVTYKLQSRDSLSDDWADDTNAAGASIPIADARLYTRLVAVIATDAD